GRARRVLRARHVRRGGCSCVPLRHDPTGLPRFPGREAIVGERAELIWYGDDAPWYDHGPEHPLRPARVILTRELITAYGILDGRRVAETVARDATDEEIGLVHGERFIDATKRARHGEPGPWGESGYG